MADFGIRGVENFWFCFKYT